ncbi:hypothetical protein J3A83DRAFT_4370025 [Scleroderma citrinum]
MDHENTHATLALQHYFTTTPTLLLPSNTNENTVQDSWGSPYNDLSSNAWISVRSSLALAGLGISCQTDIPAVEIGLSRQAGSCQGIGPPMRGQGDSFPGFPSTNMSDLAMDPFPASFSSVVDLIFPSLSSSSTMLDCAIPSSPIPGAPRGLMANPYDWTLSVADNCPASPVGFIADVNMYHVWLSRAPPALTVNPLDTIRACTVQPSPYTTNELAIPSQTPVAIISDEYYNMEISAYEGFPTPMDINDLIVWPLSSPAEKTKPFAYFSPAPPKPKMKVIEATPEQSLLSPPNPESGCSLADDLHTLPEPSVRASQEPTSPLPETFYPSPILDAHLGIELGELIEKAERFRLRFPGKEINRSWLLRFAGKLSQRGEPTEEFRCYVVGCNQRNKRRDHILVHVGAHIGQRPFACPVCSKRFLRKNECKRHEAIHMGHRPYRCDVCRQSFTRRDLVKRHRKRHESSEDKHTTSKRKQRRRE